VPGAIDFHGIARRLCQDRKATRRLIPVWIAPVTDPRTEMASLCGTRRVEPGDRSQAVDVVPVAVRLPERAQRGTSGRHNL